MAIQQQIKKKGWMYKGPDSGSESGFIAFTRVSPTWLCVVVICTYWMYKGSDSGSESGFIAFTRICPVWLYVVVIYALFWIYKGPDSGSESRLIAFTGVRPMWLYVVVICCVLGIQRPRQWIRIWVYSFHQGKSHMITFCGYMLCAWCTKVKTVGLSLVLKLSQG